MIGVDDGEYCMLHVSVLLITRNVQKIEFQCLSVRRHLAYHTRPIIRVTIMCQQQTISVHNEHGDRIVGSSGSRHLMHEGVAHRSHPKRHLHEPAFHLGLRRDGCHVGFPRTGQSFQFVEGLLCVGLRYRLLRARLRESHGGEGQQNKGQHKTKGFHVSFSLKVLFFVLGSGFIRWRTQVAINQIQGTLHADTVIVNYITISRVKLFRIFFWSAAIPIAQASHGRSAQTEAISL